MNGDRASLRTHVEDLAARKHAGRLDGLGLAALAEAYFRLGVHPETPPDEALLVLRYAAASDEGNPKFAYHLARRFLDHGDPSRAAVWLRRAIDQCPTSHRLWAHASLLQQELDECYRGDSRFEPMALRRRSEVLLERIREGADRIDPALLDFEPPPARRPDDRDQGPSPASPAHPPRRLNDPGRCRWSGVDDLAAEVLLREPPSKRIQERLLPLLEEGLGRRASRRGGDAAFAVLAVGWLIMGHPVATIRAMLPQSVQLSPSLRLVDQVCSLYELDEAELSEAIAVALREGRLPSLVVALIHHRRLLGQRLGYPAVGRAYQAAQRFVAEAAADEAAAIRLAKELRRAAAVLEPEQPIADVPEVAKVQDDEGDPATRFARQAEEVDRLAGRLEVQLPELRRLASDPSQAGPDQRTEVAATETLLYMLDRHCQSWLAEVAAIKEAGADDLPEQIGATIERLTAACQGAPKRVAAVRRQLERIRHATAVEQTADGEAAGPKPTPHGPIASLSEAVERIDRELGERFDHAAGTLDSYPPGVRSPPPVRALRAMVRAAQAETWYRLGHTDKACALWARVVRDDPLDPAVRKNLAVLATLAGDSATSMEAWSTYCQSLYAQAILAGSVRVRAQERVALHRHLGGAYAPASLAVCPDSEPPPDEGLTAAAFLGDCGVVGLFVRHKLLECLNAKLDYASPSLLLGIDRRHDEETRSRARNSLLILLWEVAGVLPEPVRGGFERLTTSAIDTAYLDCRTGHDRKVELDATYAQESKRHLEWLHQICELKERLEHMAVSHLVARGNRWPVSFLNELVLLDLIPIANSDQFLADVKHHLRIQRDPTTLSDAFTRLRKEARG